MKFHTTAIALGFLLAAAHGARGEAVQPGWAIDSWTSRIPSLKATSKGFDDVFVDDERILLTQQSTDGKAQLVVFHELGKIELFVKWNEYIDNDAVRGGSKNTQIWSWVDDREGVWTTWEISNALQATFSQHPTALISELLTAQTFSVEAQPFGRRPVRHTFDMAGFAAAFSALDGHDDFPRAIRK